MHQSPCRTLCEPFREGPRLGMIKPLQGPLRRHCIALLRLAWPRGVLQHCDLGVCRPPQMAACAGILRSDEAEGAAERCSGFARNRLLQGGSMLATLRTFRALGSAMQLISGAKPYRGIAYQLVSAWMSAILVPRYPGTLASAPAHRARMQRRHCSCTMSASAVRN